MIDRVERALRRVRRLLRRSWWAVHLLGLPRVEGAQARQGLVLIQIDGLSRRRLLDALGSGRMPVLRELIDREGYRLDPVYSGLPSTTPAAQAELFYGRTTAVPAFAFVDRSSGRLSRMYERDAVQAIEARLAEERSLVAGGASYCNVYAGDALDARFCMACLRLSDPVRTRRPLAFPLVALAHLPELLRATYLVARELAIAPLDLMRGVGAGQHVPSELKFVQGRAAVGVLLRELSTVAAEISIARGLPVVHLNLLGYDEYAHRRGPSSRLALGQLNGADTVIGRLLAAARRAERRLYDVWVLSDHGQEASLPYLELHGRTVQEAIGEVARDLGLGRLAASRADPVPVDRPPRLRSAGERILGIIVPGLDVTTRWHEPNTVTVAAQGPVGHVYLPRPLTAEETDRFARALVRDARVPLVLAVDGPHTARAWTEAGTARLPADAGELLPHDHPYLPWVAEDLVALCHHPDAGDVVISGWRRDTIGVSFPHENGTHSGPGLDETDAFVVTPPDTPLPRDRPTPLRARDLRATALALVDGTVRRPRGSRRPPPTDRTTLRVLTYNVHSCIGLDDRLAPERIARVIARHDPDVVALQELDVGRARTGGVDQAEAISHHLEMLLAFHPTITVAEERFGDAVLTRHPMRIVRAGPLPRLDGRPALEPRGALWVELEVDGRPVQVLNTHLSLHPRERGLQVDALLGPDWLGHPDAHSPLVLCGDFNALPWFPETRRLTRRLRDAQAEADGHRPRNTFGGRVPLWRIDHVLVDPAVRVSGVEVPRNELARVASDHLPVVVDLVLPPSDGRR